MSPAEAAASLDEPDWAAMFLDLGGEDSAFDAVLSQWRRWHWTPIEIDGVLKKKAASATDGIIALAQAGVMPPRSLTEAQRRPFEEQHDAHMWLRSKDRSWRILGVQDGVMMLNSYGEEWEINLKRAKWDDYVIAAAAALEQQKGPAMPDGAP